MIRMLFGLLATLLFAGLASASDCETVTDGGLSVTECWHPWPFTISTAELAHNGYELVGTSTINASSENERAQGLSAHYEISYWRSERFIFQCRSLLRDDGQSLRMTASQCRSAQPPPDEAEQNLWAAIRENQPR